MICFQYFLAIKVNINTWDKLLLNNSILHQLLIYWMEKFLSVMKMEKFRLWMLMEQTDKLLMLHTMMGNLGDSKLFQIKVHFWHVVMIIPFMNSVLQRKKWWNKVRYGQLNSLEENHMKLQRLNQLQHQWVVILLNNKRELLHIAKSGIMLQSATIMEMLQY